MEGGCLSKMGSEMPLEEDFEDVNDGDRWMLVMERLVR